MSGDKIIGTMDCWSCSREVPVKRKASGKLSMACPWCDFPHYANEHTEHFANVMKDVRLRPEPGAAAAPAPAPAQEPAASAPKPEPKKATRRGGFPFLGGGEA